MKVNRKMEDRCVADYFVVAGLPEEPERLDEFSYDEAHLKSSYNLAPITDITVIFTTLSEKLPKDFCCIESTPGGFPADLNHGSLRSPEVYLCYRRGRDKPPLVDIGVMYEGKESVMKDAEVLLSTPYGKCANVNNSGGRTFITFRRASEKMACNELVVTEICVILSNKGEIPPHAFCKINKNLNKGLMMGSDVFLCYKKSMNRARMISYKPDILARYPLEDNETFPFPSSVPMFCLPMGANIECWPEKARKPRTVFSTFVLTVSDAAEKLYGAAVTFYENFPEEKLTPEQMKELGLDEHGNASTVNVNKSICILSHWPFFDTFEKYLNFLHRLSITGSLNIPIERYISHLMEEVPFPSPQRPRILVQLSPTDRFALIQPEDIPFPRSGGSFRKLLRNLGPDNCLMMLLLTITEQKLLIHSLRPDVLTAVAEAVAMLIFPFHWQCPYIPLCPLGLSDVLNAPVPFLIGVDSRFFDMYDPPADVTCIDLDTNTISLCNEKKGISVKLLPKKPARILRSTLEAFCDKIQQIPSNSYVNDIANDDLDSGIDREFKLKRQNLLLELEIQEAFLKFMVTILKGYGSYLLPITTAPTVGTTDPSSLYNLQGFLRSRDKAYHKFFGMVMKTQMFIRFIEERSFVSNLDTSLAFFDECCEKMDYNDDSDVKLIELDESHVSERTVFVPPPDPSGLPSDATYDYPQGFTLNSSLFSVKVKKDLLSVPNKGVCVTPGSPVARRTKQEVKSAQKVAKRQAQTPFLWAKCLLNTCFSLWFIHLPSYVMMAQSKYTALCFAYNVLVKMQIAGLHPIDELCYRVMMQLCGLYSQPILAVKVLHEMKRCGVQPNAITYGFYNKAVLEAQWPSSSTNNSSQKMWNKLRNLIIGVAQFRRSLRKRGVVGAHSGSQRHLSISVDEDLIDRLSSDPDRISRTSMESGASQDSATLHGLKLNREETILENGSNQSDMGYVSLNETKGNNSRSQSSTDLKDDDQSKTSPVDGQYTFTEVTTENHVNEVIDASCVKKPTSKIDFYESDQFRSRVGSIVRSSASTMSAPSNFPAHTINSSAGLLMTGQLAGTNPRIRSHTFDLPKKWRHRSGTAGTEFSNERNSDNEQRFGAKSPNDLRNNFHMLRSESFANDAQILDKLNQLKLDKELKLEEEVLVDVVDSCADVNITITPKVNESAVILVKPIENLKKRSMSRSESQDSSSLEQRVADFLQGSSREKSEDRSICSVNSLEDDQTSIKSTEDLLGISVTDDSVFHQPKHPDVLEPTILAQGQRSPSIPIKHRPSLTHSPMRTPVTQNDPLGALSTSTTSWTQLVGSTPKTPPSTRLKTRSAEAPVTLLREENFNKPISRSSTMPVKSNLSTSVIESNTNRLVPQSSSVATSLQSISSSLFSSSSLNQKKTELVQGFNRMRSAVSTKLEEMKEVIQAQAIPIRPGLQGSMRALDDYHSQEDGLDDIDSGAAHKSLDSLSTIGGGDNNSKRNSIEFVDILVKTLYPETIDNNKEHRKYSKSEYSHHPIAVEITVTSCSKCHEGSCVLYDEEIMAGWSPEDSNLNTKCQHCSKWVVPFLQVGVCDYRNQPLSVVQALMTPAPSMESMGSQHSLLENSLNRKIVSGTNLSSLGIPECEDDPETIDEVGFSKEQTSQSSEMSIDDSCSLKVEEGIQGPINSLDNMSDTKDQQQSADTSVSSSQTKELQESTTADFVKPVSLDEISVPYLSPVVLRKEVENVLDQEGDICLTNPQFMDDHPIIYWNLVWFFSRVNVPTHLPSLCLHSDFINQGRTCHPSWSTADHKNVTVRCLWDNPKLHEELGVPMYCAWSNRGPTQSSLISALVTDRMTEPRTVIQQIIDGIKCNDLSEPLKQLITERRKQMGKGTGKSHSAYRDILFLAFVAIGRHCIDIIAFDREFRRAYEKLPKKYLMMMQEKDGPPSISASLCRRFFQELEL